MKFQWKITVNSFWSSLICIYAYVYMSTHICVNVFSCDFISFRNLDVSSSSHLYQLRMTHARICLYVCMLWMDMHTRTRPNMHTCTHVYIHTCMPCIRNISVVRQKICAINICIATATLRFSPHFSATTPPVSHHFSKLSLAGRIVGWQCQRAPSRWGRRTNETWAAELVGNDAYENFYASVTECLYLKWLKRHLTSPQPIWLAAAQWDRRAEFLKQLKCKQGSCKEGLNRKYPWVNGNSNVKQF